MVQPNQPNADKGLPALVSEFWDLVVRYAKQETIDPLKSLARFLGWGLGGAVLLGLGSVMLLLATLRVMQEELAPHLSGNWSWVPYVAIVTVAGGLIGVLAWAIGAERRRAAQVRSKLRSSDGKG